MFPLSVPPGEKCLATTLLTFPLLSDVFGFSVVAISPLSVPPSETCPRLPIYLLFPCFLVLLSLLWSPLPVPPIEKCPRSSFRLPFLCFPVILALPWWACPLCRCRPAKSVPVPCTHREPQGAPKTLCRWIFPDPVSLKAVPLSSSVVSMVFSNTHM